MREALTAVDIRELLISFDAAIELDQLRVDALPPECFHPAYSDSMWRLWRCLHRAYIKELLATVNAIPLGMLEGLTWIALNYDPAVVGDVMLDLFADAASGSCCELETATLFFGWLIADIGRVSEAKPQVGDARTLMMQWLPLTDPLCIAEDPECGYGTPAGLVS